MSVRDRFRRCAVAAAAAAVALTAVAAGAGTPPGAAAHVPAEPEPLYTFLSSPDFMNADVADLRRHYNWPRTRRSWRQRFDRRPTPNSWNRSYAAAQDVVLDAFQREAPGATLVAGDLVNGHWGKDRWKVGRRWVQTGIFGATRTTAQRKAALGRAARFYFTSYRRMFARRGLALYPTVGDHELGDNPWSRRVDRLKRASIPLVRRHFHRAFLADLTVASRPTGPAAWTAYATYLHPELLVVSLDEFQRVRRRVVGRIDAQQMTWLRGVLRTATDGLDDPEWVIVQGHLPIVPEVQHAGSSALCYEGGTDSKLWRTLVEFQVDLYFNGEVHQNSRQSLDGVTQIAHGGLFGFTATKGNTSYLVGKVFPTRLDLELKRFPVVASDSRARLYQVAPGGYPVRTKLFGAPRSIGHLELHADPFGGPAQAGKGSGPLTQYAGSERCGTVSSFRSQY